MLLKKILFFSIITLLLSCEKDSFIAPTDQNLINKLSRIYIFYQENFIGYHDYIYDNDQLLHQINTYNASDVLKRQITYTYNSNQEMISYELKDHVNNNTVNYAFTYTYFDSIAYYTIDDNSNLEKYKYTYNTNFQREKQEHLIDQNLIDYTEFYYNTSNRLWLERNFDTNDSLLYYKEYDYFYNNSIQISHYSDTAYLGYELMQYSDELLLVKHFFYNSNNNLNKSIEFSYNSNNKLERREEYTAGGSITYSYHYVYYQ